MVRDRSAASAPPPPATTAAATRRARSTHPALPQLGHEPLYVGIDVGKQRHVAGFVSTTLLRWHHRFEGCPALVVDNSREGFRQLVDRIRSYTPLEQACCLVEKTGHYHHAIVAYLLELDVSVYVMHVHKRPRGLVKTDKRDALTLANHLYNQLDRGMQLPDPTTLARRALPPTETAAQLKGLIGRRHELVHECTQRKNQLTAICDQVCPEFTQIFKDPNTPTALTVREEFPTAQALATADLNALCAAKGNHRPSRDELVRLQDLAAHSIGIRDPRSLDNLVFEQHRLIAELELLQHHVEALDAEIAQVIAHSREGQIVTSIPGIGPTQAATILAMIGNIANFDRPAQLKAYCGWAPTLTQSGVTVDRARLTPRGVRSLKSTLYLVVWQTLRHPESEFARLYAQLVPRKCVFDERARQYRGKGKVIGRVAGQLITVLFTLLKRDQERVAHAEGGVVAAPELYDPALHRRHRAGQYQSPARTKLGTVEQLPPR